MTTCFSHHVFLSFRGEDTSKTFTDHLYAALNQARIRTFRDDDAIDRGQLLKPELKQAIRESASSIIVFSRNYAFSKWCLDEVLTIVEELERDSSKHKVVPIFYDVEPSDVRNQTGSFEKAFGEYDNMIEAEKDHHKKIKLLEKVEAWRVSLKKAGSLTGMVLANGHEAEFISYIVKVIRKELLNIDENLASVASSDPCPSMFIDSSFSYDVFLSFRGEDTRKTFTDHLYAALKQAGIRTFRDNDAMDRGKLLEPELKKAIFQSEISIIVFSRNYASSRWCLDEVLKIMEEHDRLSSKHEVVPVFYDVEPSHVQNQTGSFEEAFGEYEKMIEAETDDKKKIQLFEKVNAWRVSLRKAGSLPGMVLANGYESKFISKIVDLIRKKLIDEAKFIRELMYIEEKLVGIENNVAALESWLQDPSPGAVNLVIHGMGGIGKTTLTKCIFNSINHEYDSSCFLANIRETSYQHGGLLRLQNQLLSTILRSNTEEVIWNLDEGMIKVTNALYNKKVLLVLDDITDWQQLTALLGPQGPQQFCPGSKVIITTRHKWMVEFFKTHPKVHTIKELDPNDSTKLFSLYAFNSVIPIQPYIVQSKHIVHHCSGHPLALKEWGSLLSGKTIHEWEDAICKLGVVLNPEIQKVLQLSYDTLEDTSEKDLLLHIACFFVGVDKEVNVKLLGECDFYPVDGIHNLVDRCLLYIEDGRLMMHQLIKEMGQQVVRQECRDPGKRSRLWNDQDSFSVLKENGGTLKVEGLALDMRKMDNERGLSYEDFSGRSINVGAIEKMKNLMLLQLDYATFSGSYKNLPRKLRLLRWHGFPLKSMPSDVPFQRLVVLDLRYSKLKEVWHEFKEVGSLKILNLSYSLELIKTPDFCGLPSLESLLLEECVSLTQVCEFIGYLERLVLLDISGCTSLKDVPRLPRSLQSLKMHGCSNVGGVGQVQCFDSCSLSSLVAMDVSECNLLDNSFPEDWSNLFSLKSLNISSNHITSLPGCVKSLPSLLELEVCKCSHLQLVLDVPKSVTDLYTQGNMSLEIVQPTPNPLSIFLADGCEKLCAVEGCVKLESIKKVDRKILRYLGLESILECGMGYGFDKQKACREGDSNKVSYEFGIFSSCVSGKTLPCFRYKEIGSLISFKVPSHPNGSRISGLNVCFIVSTSLYWKSIVCDVKVNNKTKGVVWTYSPTIQVSFKKKGVFNCVWLSLWRTGNLLDDGDEVVVSSELTGSAIVKECCVNFVYDDDEVREDNQEEKFNHISWTNRMRVEVSDFVHSGKTYRFMIGDGQNDLNIGGSSDSIVDWWGPRADLCCRHINAGALCVN